MPIPAWRQAEAAYRKALGLDAGLAAAQPTGTDRAPAGGRTGARAEFEAALALDPDQPEARFNCANCCWRWRPGAGVAELRRVLLVAPDLPTHTTTWRWPWSVWAAAPRPERTWSGTSVSTETKAPGGSHEVARAHQPIDRLSHRPFRPDLAVDPSRRRCRRGDLDVTVQGRQQTEPVLNETCSVESRNRRRNPGRFRPARRSRGSHIARPMAYRI